jgi:hygromycin-B 4-O-kinase
MTPTINQIGLFLTERFGHATDVAVLQGGAWSSAYRFVAHERDLVMRVGNHRSDFDKELLAATWREPGLPVPEVLEVGEAFDGHYIVSQLHHGTKLADIDPSRVPEAIEGLFEVLAAMRRVVLPGEGFGLWHAPDCDAPAATWSVYLCGLADRDESRLIDWKRKLSSRPLPSKAFHLGCAALQARARDLPTTRGLVHADLLLNHLVSHNNEITAVFDWGNALAGDPLYDVAWITYCIPWFPAIDRRHVLDLARRHFPSDNIDVLLPLYELHIAVESLQYQAFIDDVPELERTAERIDAMLYENKGPDTQARC